MKKINLTIENGQPVATEIQPVEVEGQRVLTTELLAGIYEVDPIRIQQGFIRNKDKFQKEKHYFRLTGEELKEFKANYLKDSNLKYASELMLWTERGANRHCKILDTDKAWQQFDNLEETYFRVKEIDPYKGLSKEVQAIFAIDKKTQEIEKKLTGITDKFEELPLFTVDSKELSKVANRVVVKFLGGKGTPAYKELKRKVYSDLYRQVWREFDVTSCAAIKRKDLEEAKKIISEYKLPRALANEIQTLNNQVSF
ncbi:TPA: ORF6C domain-containing protein [Clostridium botulinum]|nr:ORF6C domain-containing protein [Clostridium botulinum]